MGHAFICEYCECYHTVTDGCDEYDQNRANRIMVNNETQKENEMALEDVLAQKWIDSAKEIAELRAENGRRNYTIRRAVERAEKAERERDTLRAENDRLEDEAYTARQAAKGENALRLESERMNGQTIATLRAKVEEAYIYVVESECYCLPRAIPGDGMCERCVWLEGRDDG